MHYTLALRYEFGRNSHYLCERSTGESSLVQKSTRTNFRIWKRVKFYQNGSERDKSINVNPSTA